MTAVDPSPEPTLLEQAINLWRCSCGNLNEGSHGAYGLVNDNGHYDVCQRCGFEIYATDAQTARLKAEAYYLAVPVTRPWTPSEESP